MKFSVPHPPKKQKPPQLKPQQLLFPLLYTHHQLYKLGDVVGKLTLLKKHITT